jgi:DNA/RNA-binding domain of Phe-tRNA-synthetase-like protein
MQASQPTGVRQFSLSSELQGRVRVGVVGASPINVAPSSPSLLDEIERLGEDLRERFVDSAPADIQELRPARELYRSFGIDPTKIRPSSEALLRRLLKSKPFPRVSNAVDLCNYLAVRCLLPMGLYDATRVDGPATMRRGLEGETYEGIRKASVHLSGRPVLADDLGPFGNPTSDSLRTSVTDSTSSILLVIFAPADFSSKTLDAYLSETAEAVRRHLENPASVEVRRFDGWGQ